MPSFTNNLPEGFVYLEQVDPSIVQSSMYYHTHNFVGVRIKGYNASKVIMTQLAANALAKVQQDIMDDNYSLVVYDAYRPEKAVKHFIEWGEDTGDTKMKESFYPYLSKEEIFQGYLAKRSAHSRGSTIDLTIIERGKALNPNPQVIKRKLRDGRIIPYFDDNTVDMYSSVDLMDVASNHDTTLIGPDYLARRNYLRDKMKKYNFKEYSLEWWHYTLEDEPFKTKYFDFDVE